MGIKMRYAGKKLIIMLITLPVVSFFVFWAFDLIAGDPALTILGTQATPGRLAELRRELGLDAPFLVRFGRWLTDFAGGNMGISYSYRRPVTEMVADKLPITLTLTLLAFIMIILLAVPLGIYTAKHAGRPIDRVLTAVNQMIMAFPPFFTGILLTLVFGLGLRWFAPGGYVSYQDHVGGFIGYLLVPALAVALPKAAMAAKLLRGSVLAEAGQDYVRTAYSRGGTTNWVLYRHVLRNALIPLITFLGMALTDMLVGSIIIEQVFAIPGMGRILLNSIANRDYPVIMAIIVCLAALVLAVNIIVDLIYGLVDPRIAV